MGVTQAQMNTIIRTQSNKRSRTCCMGGPWLGWAISPTAPFFVIHGHVDIVSSALPLLAALLKGHSSPSLPGDVTPAVKCHGFVSSQGESHGSREDGKNLPCMFVLTICFRKQERKQRAFAAPSVSLSHAARLGYSQLLHCQAVTQQNWCLSEKELKMGRQEKSGQDDF